MLNQASADFHWLARSSKDLQSLIGPSKDHTVKELLLNLKRDLDIINQSIMRKLLTWFDDEVGERARPLLAGRPAGGGGRQIRA